jgi:hypothetical protein
MTAKTRAKPSLHRDSFVAPLARGIRTLPGAVVGLRLLKHTAGPLEAIAIKSAIQYISGYKYHYPEFE